MYKSFFYVCLFCVSRVLYAIDEMLVFPRKNVNLFLFKYSL